MTEDDKSKLNFMYNKISVPKMSMVYWLKTPEFVDRVFELYEKGATIDDQTVYGIMVSVYDEVSKYKGTPDGKRYNFSKMRQGIRRLKEKLEA